MVSEDVTRAALVEENKFLTHTVGALWRRLGGGEVKIPMIEWGQFDGTEMISVKPSKHTKGMVVEVRKQ